MAELLIRTVDKVNVNSRIKNSKCSKRGDVIAIFEDNWPWSVKEKTNPEWVIKKFPGILASQLSGFLAPEPGNPLLDPYLQRRAFTFNFVAILPARPTLPEVLAVQKIKLPWSDRAP